MYTTLLWRGKDAGQGLNDVFDALVRRQQAKSQQNFLSFRPEAVLVEIGIGERQIGNAVRDQIDLGDRDAETLPEESPQTARLMTIRRSDSAAISTITARWSGSGSRSTVCSVVTIGILRRRNSSRM